MTTLTAPPLAMTSDQNRQIASAVKREGSRLRRFIRRFVDDSDAEDILQDVFSELTEAHRLMQPIEQVGAWLYRVARNRITDRFRKRGREVTLPEPGDVTQLQELSLDRLLPDADAGPESAFTRQVLLEEIFHALDELPRLQRDAFVAHEIEGVSFKDMAAASGVPVATLLSRKHSAVLHLRSRLQSIFADYANDGS